jgi:CRISPR/Cas system-associated protein Csm6
MKTTIEIRDTLLQQARKLASEEKTSLRALVEEGLRRIIEERRGTKAFRLPKASFKGKGLQPQVKGFSWDQIRDVACEGRGG